MPILTDLGLSRGRVHALQQSTRTGLRLPGTAGNYASSPDSVLNSITGDIDIRVYAKLDNWNSGAVQHFLGKRSSFTGYAFRINAAGAPEYVFGNGAADSFVTASGGGTAWVTPTAGTAKWLRITHDVDNGAGQNVRSFYSSDDGITWALVGTANTGSGVTAIGDGLSLLALGADSGGNAPMAGTIYYAEVRRGIDGPIISKFDASTITASGGTTPSTINGWTWNGSTLYKRDDYVRLPGTAGNYLSYPDTVANSVTGDIDIRAKLSADNFSLGTSQVLVSKWETVGNQRSYLLRLDPTNTLALFFSPDGTAASQLSAASAALPTTNGLPLWVRATRVNSTGVMVFSTSPDGVTWTVITTSGVVGAGQALFDGSAALLIGAQVPSTPANFLAGNVYYAEVRNGIGGTVVASWNGADNMVQTPWTINGAAWNWEGASFNGKPGIALSLPGTSGNYASTPDTAGNSVVGDFDVRIKVALDDWTPASFTYLLSKTDSSTNCSWSFGVNANGSFGVMVCPDGASANRVFAGSTVPGFADGSTHWLRYTWIDSTNAYTTAQSDDGVTWTTIQTGTLASAGIFDGTAAIAVGGQAAGGGNTIAGKVYYAEVRNGIDGPVVATFNPTNIAKTGTRTPASTVQPGGTPNLLTPNQASIETDATGWSSNTAAPTLAQDATQFLDGTHSLSVTATAAGPTQNAFVTVPNTQLPVVAGKLYTVRASFRAAATPQTCAIGFNWRTAAGGFISNSTGSSVSDTTSGWTEVTATFVAPATAAFVTLAGIVNGMVVGEVHYVDRISFVEAAETWTINGSAWDWVVAA